MAKPDPYQDFFKKAQRNSQAKAPLGNPRIPSRINKVNLKKKNLSKKTVFNLGIIFILALAAFAYVDEVDKFLSKLEISFLSSAKAEGSEVKPPESAPASEKPSSSKEEDSGLGKNASGENENSKVGQTKTEQKDYSESELNHFARLSERKIELDQREKEIQKMEVEIGKQKIELEKKMVELDEMRKKIGSVLEEKVQVDDKRVENLVQFYSSMKPQQAAKIIENIDEGLAVEVLARMKKKSAADIMNLLKPEKAQVISEKYAGYRK